MAATAFGQLALVADDLRAGKVPTLQVSPASPPYSPPTFFPDTLLPPPTLQTLRTAKLSKARRLHAQKYDPEVPVSLPPHNPPPATSS